MGVWRRRNPASNLWGLALRGTSWRVLQINNAMVILSRISIFDPAKESCAKHLGGECFIMFSYAVSL